MARKTFNTPYAPIRLVLMAIVWIGVTSVIWYCVMAPTLELFFSTKITTLGNFSGVSILSLVLWGVLDVLFRRRQIYALWGLMDPPLRPSLRYMRLFLLILGPGAALAIYVRSSTWTSPESAIGTLPVFAVLASALIAALGIIVSNFQSQALHRSTETEKAVSDLIQNPVNRTVKRAATLIYVRARGVGLRDGDRFKPLPLSEGDGTFSALLAVRQQKEALNAMNPVERALFADMSRDYWVGEYLNCLDRIAFSTRSGFYDFDHVNELLWEIILSAASRWREFLEAETSGYDCVTIAKWQSADIRIMPRRFIYEDLCWLIYEVYDRAPAEERANFDIGAVAVRRPRM